MYTEKKRERRRRDYLRMKKRAKRIQQDWWTTTYTETELDIASSKLANNISVCSCWMCGNPRKWWKDNTIQEQKAYDDAMEQLKDAWL